MSDGETLNSVPGQQGRLRALNLSAWYFAALIDGCLVDICGLRRHQRYVTC